MKKWEEEEKSESKNLIKLISQEPITVFQWRSSAEKDLWFMMRMEKNISTWEAASA